MAHPIIQKEVDWLLAKGASEPSMDGAGFTQMYFWYQAHWWFMTRTQPYVI